MNCIPDNNLMIPSSMPEVDECNRDDFTSRESLNRVVKDRRSVLDVARVVHLGAGPVKDHPIKGAQLTGVEYLVCPLSLSVVEDFVLLPEELRVSFCSWSLTV